MRQAPPLGLGIERDDLRAFGLGIAQVALEALQLAFVDNRSVVRIVSELRKKALHSVAVGGDERIDTPPGDQHIVRRHASLPGVECLAEGYALGDSGQRYLGGDDSRRLTSQLESHRG